jgi:hypothetical protein
MESFIVVILIGLAYLGEINDCKKVGGEYNVLYGCSIDTFIPNTKGLGLPKELQYE